MLQNIQLELLWKNTQDVLLEALPFLAFGLFVAGLLKAFVPTEMISKHLGKENIFSPIKASIFGIPIPLCSCSVIPVATGLRRSGAGKGSIASFLISAPVTGVDSISISYAILGPVILVARLIASIITALTTAWAIMFFTKNIPMAAIEPEKNCCHSANSPASPASKDEPQTIWKKFYQKFYLGQRYSFTTLLDESSILIMVALVLTVFLKTYIPEDTLNNYGDGIWAMLVMVAISFPLYICASASTTVAAGLLAIGVSPGAALVFMLAGPASNIATLGVVTKLINKPAAVIYLIAVIMVAIFSGLAFNEIIELYNIDIASQIKSGNILHLGLAIPASVWVILAAIKPLRPYIGLADKQV